MKIRSKRVRKAVRGVIFPILLLGVWWGLARLEIVLPLFLPPPGKVVTAFFALLRDGILAFNLKVSFARLVSGALLGISAGVVLGTLMGVSKTVEKLVAPLFNAVRQVPLLGWIPLIILWFGVAETSKLVFIAVGASYPIVLSTFEGIRNVKKEYVEVGRLFEYSGFELFRKIILPSTLPPIITGLRLSLNIAWGQLVAAELFFAAAGGLGNMIGQGRERWRMDIVMVGVILIGVIGFALDYLAKSFETRVVHWRNTFN